MGKRKDLFHADIMLDDGIHNLLESNCTLPVLFRQPWNQNASGICCVDDYADFLTLVDFMNGNKCNISRIPKILCIVGPSGSRKRDLAETLCRNDLRFELIKTCTTAKGHKCIRRFMVYLKMTLTVKSENRNSRRNICLRLCLILSVCLRVVYHLLRNC